MDEVENKLAIPAPDYIKIDVDGVEHLILKGGQKILSKVDSVLIEINDEFLEQAEKAEFFLNRSTIPNR